MFALDSRDFVNVAMGAQAITAITSLLGHEHDPALPPMHDFHGLLQHLQDVQKFDCQNNVTSSSSV